jgi:peptidoglycan/LPS O-acetylase OafA/YrhL
MRKVAAIEGLRGFAATYVFLGHLVLGQFTQPTSWLLIFRLGQEAVMLFFLVSGFVIMFSMETAANKSVWAYLRRRFFRIYPIFLLALALGYALSKDSARDVPTLLGNLFMLQDFSDGKPGVLFSTFAGNLPLWSLSYEWWFYLAFIPLYWVVPRASQLLLVTSLAVAAAVLYNLSYFQPFLFVAYFPIWWAGAEIARAVVRHEAIPYGRILLALGSLTVTFGAYALANVFHTHQLVMGVHPMLEFRHAAASLALVALVWAYQSAKFVNFDRALTPFIAVAPISYGIYALHYPIVSSSLLISWPMWLRIPALAVAVMGVAWIAEKPYQRAALKLPSIWDKLRRVPLAD